MLALGSQKYFVWTFLELLNFFLYREQLFYELLITRARTHKTSKNL